MIFVFLLLVTVSFVTLYSIQDTPATRSTFEGATRADTLKDAEKLAPVAAAIDAFQERFSKTPFKYYSDEHRVEATQLMRRIAAINVHTLLGKSIQAEYVTGLSLDRILCNQVSGSIRDENFNDPDVAASRRNWMASIFCTFLTGQMTLEKLKEGFTEFNW
jgi:hypothetical protein